MEFLDINLTKDLIILLHAIHSPFYCRGFDRKPYSTLVLKNTYKKFVKQENSSLFMNGIL